MINGLPAKEVELLHDLVPKAAVIGFLVNPKDPNTEPDTGEAEAVANALGEKLVIAKQAPKAKIESAFTTFAQQQVAAVFVDTERSPTRGRLAAATLADQPQRLAALDRKVDPVDRLDLADLAMRGSPR